MIKLILLRHGQSQWNLENRFTGWCDADLTEQGISEAKKAGFKPVYSMKHPSIKVLMQRSSSRKIETDKFKTTTIDIEHFWYMCRHLL